MDKFDFAKKARLTQDQKRESIAEKSPSRTSSIDTASLNRKFFFLNKDFFKLKFICCSLAFDENEDDTIHPEWVLEVPEELDVYIAQRQFENALNLLQKAKEYIEKNEQLDHILIDIQRKVIFDIVSLLRIKIKKITG